MVATRGYSSKKGQRKRGERYASGDLKPKIAPAEISRMTRAAKLRVADPSLGSHVGWLCLSGVLNDGQMAAALKWAITIGQYDRVQGLPRRTVKSPSYEMGFGGKGSSLSADPDYEKAVIEGFEGATNALKNHLNFRIAQLVTVISLDHRSAAWWEYRDLRKGLDILALYFGIKRC